jgi:hypothetical protein
VHSDIEVGTIIDGSAAFWRYVCMYLAVSMAQILLGTGYYFFAVHFEGFTKNYPFLFEGLQNILKGMWRAGPQNKGNSPSILLPGLVDAKGILKTFHPFIVITIDYWGSKSQTQLWIWKLASGNPANWFVTTCNLVS